MPLGIDPTVDFAFQRMFGNPEHPNITIHFLNAILQPVEPVTEVEILNPVAGKERLNDKLGILDVLARDRRGRLFNIEMQTTLPEALQERLLYYNCRNYTRQINEGEDYGELRPSISICVLDQVLFRGQKLHHLSFRLRCDQCSELVFTPDLEFHTLELPKFQPPRHNAERFSALDKWTYLLRFAPGMEAEELANQLEETAFREAVGVLDMISKSEEELLLYENRIKASRDERARLSYALNQGIEQGIEKGRLQGTVQTLQESLMTETPATLEELQNLTLAELQQLVEQLRSKLRQRM